METEEKKEKNEENGEEKKERNEERILLSLRKQKDFDIVKEQNKLLKSKDVFTCQLELFKSQEMPSNTDGNLIDF